MGLQRFGRPFKFTATKPGKTQLGLEEAHRDLRISPAEFDEVAAELGRTLDHFKVPKRERAEVLAVFAAHKDEVTAGYVAKKARLKHPAFPGLDNPVQPMLAHLAKIHRRRSGQVRVWRGGQPGSEVDLGFKVDV